MDEWDQFQDAPDAGAGLYKQYPGLKKYGVQVKDSTASGKDWRGQPYAGRKMEFYLPEEGYNPNPGKPTIEMFSGELSQKDAMGEVFSHYLPTVDPEFKSARQAFIGSIDAKQKQMLYGDYQSQLKSGAFEGKRPSFDEWINTNGGDAFFRGYVADQYPKEFYRQDQVKMFDPLMAKLNDSNDPWSKFQDVPNETDAQPARQAPQRMGVMTDAIGEPLLNMASGMAATPIAGIAGLLAGGDGDVVNRVQNFLTYQPRTKIGQKATEIATYPFQKLAEGADYLGGKAAEISGSPAVGAAVNTGIQAAPALLFRGRAKPVGEDAVKGFKANEAAKDYVNTRTGLSWNDLSEGVKSTLQQVGLDAANFDKLDPAAAARQLQLATLKKPITSVTRGQVTRDPIQLQREELLKSTEAGAPLRDQALEQNRSLIENLDILKGKKQQPNLATGGRAIDAESTGASVQNAERLKEAKSKQTYNGLYETARKTEPDATVPVDPLYSLLEKNPEVQHLGFMQSWLNKAKLQETQKAQKASVDSLMNRTGPTEKSVSNREVTLAELDDLRKKAGGIASKGGTDAFYAGEVVRAINNAFDSVPESAKAWTAARDAFKRHKLEFDEQGAVEGLVGNKSRTDRSVALEDTWKKAVVSGSLDDLSKVQRSLLTGGDAETRTAGRKAWRDLQAQTIEYIKSEATKGITNQAGELNVTYNGIRQAVNKIGPDKLKAILGEKDAATVQNIVKAAETLKTQPGGTGVTGSNTVNKLLNMLDKMPKIPFVSTAVEGTLQAGLKVAELGKGGREARKATTSQFNDLAKQSTASVNQLNKSAMVKNNLGRYGVSDASASQRR